VGHGAFRPYQHPATQQCLQDIMDGYFPSELQPRYPEGVPFSLTPPWVSLSSVEPPREAAPGHPWHLALSWWLCPHWLLSLQPSSADTHLLWLQGSDGQQSSKEILVGTPGLAALERCRYSPPRPALLRVRSESGEQTYELRMLLTDTIGDLRQLLAHLRGGNSDYEIVSTFPQRVYTDSSRSLQECGLVPRASLLLRRRDPSQQQGRGTGTGPTETGDPPAPLPAPLPGEAPAATPELLSPAPGRTASHQRVRAALFDSPNTPNTNKRRDRGRDEDTESNGTGHDTGGHA
uniref:UBX11 protein n=1 Tax=Serinus canaria TaxID=9135 RepID=A0A8C9MW57_SERCA